MKEFLEPTAIAYQSPEHVETFSHSLQLNSAHSVLQGVWFNSVLYAQAGKLGYRKLKDGQWFGQWLFHERILGTSDTGSSILSFKHGLATNYLLLLAFTTRRVVQQCTVVYMQLVR